MEKDCIFSLSFEHSDSIILNTLLIHDCFKFLKVKQITNITFYTYYKLRLLTLRIDKKLFQQRRYSLHETNTKERRMYMCNLSADSVIFTQGYM